MYKVTLITLFLTAVAAVDFEIRNNLDMTVWVGIQGIEGLPLLANGGFKLDKKASRVVPAPDNYRGRFWARTYCDDSTNHCLTGDCGNKVECGGTGGTPPVSLAEIWLKGNNGQDVYDISLVDGYNVPISIEPVGGQGDGGKYSCTKSACPKYLNKDCPNKLKVNGPNGVIACKSNCLAYQTDEYCCRGPHGTPEKCKNTEYFKSNCPDAYSYPYDDRTSTFTCKANKYIIVFGV